MFKMFESFFFSHYLRSFKILEYALARPEPRVKLDGQHG